MKTLLIDGSERENGNCHQLAIYIRDLMQGFGCSVTIIHLRNYDIQPCGQCLDCNVRDRACDVVDDTADIVERMKMAEAIIYIASVHAFGLAQKMQTFLERAGVGYLRFHRPLSNKLGGAIIVGRRYGHSFPHSQILHNLLLNKMVVVGSGYPATLMGGRPGKVLSDTEGLSSVLSMVERMLEYWVRLNSNAVDQLDLSRLNLRINERDCSTAALEGLAERPGPEQ